MIVYNSIELGLCFVGSILVIFIPMMAYNGAKKRREEEGLRKD